MWIDYIELQNIRSYVHTRISFQRGVNFISGVNGAGKTTIIEAIGLVLFGSKVAGEINTYFLRYGETKGRITLGICIQNGATNEKFEIQRLIGTATTCRIFDQTGQLDLSGQEDVYAFLKKKLLLEDSKDLSALFENVIAVRQGAFTAPFLAAPQERKKKFDTILQLDHYRTAANESKKLIDEVKKRQQKQSEQLAYLNGRLLEKEDVQASYQGMQELILEQQTMFDELKIKSESIAKRYLEEKTKQARYQKIQKTRENILLELEVLKKEHLLLEQHIQESMDALQQKQELESSEIIYVQLLEQLDVQKKNNEKFEQLKQQYELLYHTWIQENKHIASMEQYAHESIKQASKKKKEAQEQFRQEETTKEHIQKQLDDLEQKARHLEQDELDFKKEEEQSDVLETIDHIIIALRERIAEQKQQEQNLSDKLKEEKEVNQRLQRSEEIDKKLRILQQEYQEYLTMIERLQSDLQKFISGECPYTSEPCVTVQSLEVAAEEKLKQVKLSLKENEKQEKSLMAHFEPVDALKRQSIELEKDSSIYQELIQQKKIWQEQIEIHLQQASESASQIFEDIDQLNIFVLNKKGKMVAWEEDIRKQQLIQSEAMHQLQTSIVQNQNTIERLTEQIQSADHEIKERELKLAEQNKEKIKQMERWNELQRLDNEKAQYDGVAESYQKLLEQLDIYQPMHDDYLKSTALAKRIENEQLMIEDVNTQMETQQKLLVLADKNFQEMQELFDLQKLEDVAQEQADITMKISQEQIRFEEKEAQFKIISDKIARLQQLECEREEEMKQLDQLNDLQKTTESCRKIYEKTGERMARLLCEQLGYEANRYYRILSAEETQLVWAENYAIELHDRQDGVDRIRSYRSLSGGEQISAGIALRLALLKKLSTLDIAFFDEPTTHLDRSRRRTLAEVLPSVVGDFSQVFFVSHDDTFDAMAENMIAIGKTSEGSVVL